MERQKTKRTHKDEVFRMLFKEPSELLSLYNAVNGTAYENVSQPLIPTCRCGI